jgi:two-component system response regulator NreC
MIRVFIADDHAVFRCGLKALLENEPDIRVVGETGSGFETIRAVAEAEIDVLLLDITMPGLPGPRVAESVLEHDPSLSIVVLTMHEDEYYVREMFRIGVQGFVLKKSTGSELVQAIRAVHDGHQYIDPAVAAQVLAPFIGRPARTPGRLGALTRREREVCHLLALGHTNSEVASQLSISERTVESHRNKIMSKLELQSRAELVRFALDNGLMGHLRSRDASGRCGPGLVKEGAC